MTSRRSAKTKERRSGERSANPAGASSTETLEPPSAGGASSSEMSGAKAGPTNTPARDRRPRSGVAPSPSIRGSRGLTPKQARFVEEYLVDLNATQAAIRSGYSRRTAEKIGSENLHKPEVSAAIEQGKKALSEKTGITQDRVLKELARVAFADPRRVMRWSESGVSPIPSEDLSDDDAAIVSSVTETKTKDGGSMKIQTNDKIRALELLGKHLGIFPEKRQITGPDGKDLFPISAVRSILAADGGS